MKHIIICLMALIVYCLPGHAQKCTTSEKVLESMARDPEVAVRVAEIEAFTREYINSYRGEHKATGVQVIPVVIHILSIAQSENISDEQVMSEFPILNDAFRNRGFPALSVPPSFYPVAGDAEIEFCLAKIAPNGTPTTGIQRWGVPASFNGETDYFDPAKHGVTPWDPKRYVNVYLVRLNTTHLGFTYKPATAPKGEEGIVIDTRAWGNVGTAASNPPYNMGMTAVHEFGHYFNLDHTWGLHVGCAYDDGITDTPPQDAPTWGCPSFPQYDPCTATGNGIMFMNFMNYSDDICLAMFTTIQTLRMKAALAGPFKGLAGSYLCNPVAVNDVEQAAVVIYPNPANREVHVSVSPGTAFRAELLNSNGAVVLSADALKVVQLSTVDLPGGIYTLRVTSATQTTVQKVLVNH